MAEKRETETRKRAVGDIGPPSPPFADVEASTAAPVAQEGVPGDVFLKERKGDPLVGRWVTCDQNAEPHPYHRSCEGVIQIVPAPTASEMICPRCGKPADMHAMDVKPTAFGLAADVVCPLCRLCGEPRELHVRYGDAWLCQPTAASSHYAGALPQFTTHPAPGGDDVEK
jgi:hypothetical protein